MCGLRFDLTNSLLSLKQYQTCLLNAYMCVTSSVFCKLFVTVGLYALIIVHVHPWKANTLDKRKTRHAEAYIDVTYSTLT
jgi:hypothetical protein